LKDRERLTDIFRRRKKKTEKQERTVKNFKIKIFNENKKMAAFIINEVFIFLEKIIPSCRTFSISNRNEVIFDNTLLYLEMLSIHIWIDVTFLRIQTIFAENITCFSFDPFLVCS